MPLEFGLNTFGDITLDSAGKPKTHAQVLRDVVVEAEAADAAGLDSFGVGEHHRDDFAISAPEVLLGAIASRTKRIRLGTAVTVLSTDDPVRVYERFATLDGVSNGRAEIILGRGSFTESYPLFGYSLENYEELFEEKLELFAKLRQEGAVTWKGKLRSGLNNQRVFPPAEKAPIPTWVGVGGSPESVVRAAKYGLPLMLAIIGGNASRFKPYVDLYREACEKFGHGDLPVAVHSPGHVAETDAQAKEEYWKAFKGMHDRIGAERGWPPMTMRAFESEVEGGAMYVGSAETVSRKVIETVKGLGLARFDIKYSAGTLSHEAMLKSIGLFGREVVPRVRAGV
ncbi:MAG TPA: LLM class flavin-dependent oxidoreductase [Gemmatimonadaceae bacterium]|nr:LLM class flavin-dependent oxidoreductase [Gemmatimonadaceae bacterium]